MTCRDCKHCKILIVPVLPENDHARNVRNRYVCTANEGYVEYLGDDEGNCGMYTPKESEK